MSRTLPLALLLLALPAFAGFEVSSFRKEDKLGKNYWNAQSALDSKPETCWQVDPEKNNVGEWLALDVPAGEIDKLAMITGWGKSDETFSDYARVKAAKVEIMDSGAGTSTVVATHTVTFEDKNGWQIVDLPDTKVGGEVLGGRVKVTVTEVYPGKDFPSLAVSEVRVHLKEFDAASGTYARPPDSEAGSNTGDLAWDGNAKTFWAATGSTANFAVKAPGYGMSSIGFQSGPKSHARPKTLEITANQTTSTVVLEDKPGQMVYALLPCLVGYTGGAWGDVEIKVLDAYPGDVASNGIAVAEMKVLAGSIEEF
jgi:hypothetical protein